MVANCDNNCCRTQHDRGNEEAWELLGNGGSEIWRGPRNQSALVIAAQGEAGAERYPGPIDASKRQNAPAGGTFPA